MIIRIAGGCQPLSATLRVPSDKSIAQRRILFSLLATNPYSLEIFQPGEDVLTASRAVSQLGVNTREHWPDPSTLRIDLEPVSHYNSTTVDCGNSATTMRLLAGILAGCKGEFVLIGDASLSKRPMLRVADPLLKMGANIRTTEGHSPLYITGNTLSSLTYRLPVPSAQIKSAIMLAAVQSSDESIIIESIASRDHTERMLGLHPNEIDGEIHWHVSSRNLPHAIEQMIPGDLSSAAFWIGAAYLVAGSSIVIRDCGVSPTRSAFINKLACEITKSSLQTTHSNSHNCEPIGNLVARSGEPLHIKITERDVPGMIDEIPILAVVAAGSQGSFEVSGASELRHKETDRIHALVTGLRTMGVECEEFDDGFRLVARQRLNGTLINCFHDHRIAMSFAIAGLVATGTTTLENAECAEVSYPNFFQILSTITGAIS